MGIFNSLWYGIEKCFKLRSYSKQSFLKIFEIESHEIIFGNFFLFG